MLIDQIVHAQTAEEPRSEVVLEEKTNSSPVASLAVLNASADAKSMEGSLEQVPTDEIAKAIREYTSANLPPKGMQLKDFATALSIFVTSLAALLVTFWYNWQQNERQKKESLTPLTVKALDMYHYFWTEGKLAEVREMISQEESYREIAPILSKRNSMLSCEVSKEEYKILEKVDMFYAVIMGLHRLRLAMERFGDLDEVVRIERTYGFWREILIRNNNNTEGESREALRIYVTRFWKPVLDGINDTGRFGARDVPDIEGRTNNPMDRSGGSTAS